MIKKFIFFILICFLLNNVFALGVSPGTVKLDFKPDSIESFEYSIVNSPAKDQNVEAYVSLSGINEDLKEEFEGILSIEKTKVIFTKDIPLEKINVLVKFPKGFSKAGIYELSVGARTFVEGVEGGLSATAGNEVRVLLNVSAEYADSKFALPKKIKILNIDASPVEKGNTAYINITIQSQATSVLNNVYGIVKAIKDGDELASAETPKTDMYPGETKVIVANFVTSDFPIALIPLTAEVFYEKRSVKANGMLEVIARGGVVKKAPVVEKCRKTGTSYCTIWIIVLLAIIAILIFLLLRGGGKPAFSSYDFSSESPGKAQD